MKSTSALRSFLALTGSSLLAISSASATTLYWDGLTPAGAPGGGTGTWNTTLTNWDNTQSADSSSNWVDGNIAYFGGTAGTVTLGTNISVGGLRFDTAGYVINTGANTLSFGTGDNNILLNGNTTTGGTNPVTATITGAVGGSGNAIFSFGAIQAWAGGFQNLGNFGFITLNGTSTTGWSGTTTVKQGMTLTLSGSNQGLVSTTGITLLGGTRNAQAGTAGGGITITNTTNTEAGLDRVSSAAITSYGGNITVTNTAAAVTSYAETMGALDLRLGTLNVTQTNAVNSGTQTLTFGSNSLTNVNGVARTNATTSNITFSGASLGANARNSIIITGQADTAANQIIAPWATYGANAGAQTDYATYNITGGVTNAFGIQGAGIAASNEDTWATAANAYTLSGATALTGTRTIAALRYTGNAQILGLGNFNLQTSGVLNGGTGLLTISTAGSGALTTASGGGNLYLTTGNNSITISAPITNNGSDAVTVVRNGSADGAILTLSGNNTFSGGLVLNTGSYNGATRLVGTQSFTGGVILNGGALGDGTTPLTAAALNNNAITVNGLAQIFAANNASFSSSSSITINSTGALDLGASGTVTVNGAVSGDGTLLLNHGNTNSASTVILASIANTFTGNVVSSNFNGGSRPLYVNSFGDGGKFTVGYNSANGSAVSKIFGLHSGAIAPLTFSTRQFELIGPNTGNIDNLTLSNNSGQAFTINTDLLVNALGTRTLTLQGTGAGLSTFAGKLENGSLTSLAITKAEAGTWILSGSNNSYTGVTTISNSGGILRGTTANAFGDTTSIDIGSGTLQLRGDSTATFGKTTGGAAYTTKITATGATINVDRNTVAGTNQTFTLGAQTITSTAATVNTTISGANNTSLILGAVTDTTAANGTVQYTNSITGGGSLTLASFAGTRTGTPTLQFSGVGNTTVTGAIGQTGTQSLTKDGAGTLTLNGTNGYTGATAVSAGKLLLGSSGSLNAGSAVTVSGGAIGGTGTVNGTVALTTAGGIDLRDGAVGTFTLGNTLGSTGALGTNNLYFDFGNGVVTSDLLSVAGTTTVTNAGGAVININQLGTAAGATNGTYTLIGGIGTLDATNFAKFSLGTTAALGKTYTLVHDSGTENGNLQVTVASATAVTAAGFWAGGATNWSSASNWKDALAGATLSVTPDYSTNITFSATSANLTNTLDTDFNINSLIFTNASGNVTINGTKMLTIEAAAVNGNTLGNGIDSQKTTGTNTISAKIGLGRSQTWTVATGGTLTVSGAITDFGLGHTLTKDGLGTLTLSGTNTLSTGGTNINAGTVVGNSLGSGQITFTGNGALQPTYNTNPTYTQNIVINPGVTGHLNAANQFYHHTVSGVVSGTGTLLIGGTDNGSGNVTLSNTGNTHTGIIRIGNPAFTHAGNLITAGIADGVGAGAIQLGGTSGAGNLTFSGTSAAQNFANRVFTLSGTTGGGTITNNGATANIVTISQNLAITNNGAKTLTLGGSNTGANTFAGSIGDSGAGATSLTKANDGAWALTNTSNGFTGAILFNGTTGSNGILAYASAGGANPITFSQTTGTATLSYTGAAKTMSGAITANALTTGTITLDASGTGAVNYSNTGSLGSATSNTARNLILSGTNTGNNILAGQWVNNTGTTNAATLTKNGVGKWVLSGNNAYTGTTTINGGTLALGANDVLPDLSPVSINAATLDAATFDDSVGTLDVSAASTINLGSGANLAFAASNAVDWIGGTLNLTGALNFSGGPSSSLRFGTTNGGLTAGQLLQIASSGWTSFALDADGYLTAIPTGGGNIAPTISDIVNPPSFPSGGSTGALAFTVGDEDPASVVPTRSSSNTSLVPNGNIVFGGSGASRTVTVTPVSGLSGSATITVTLTDNGSLTVQDTFVVTVTDNYLSWATANGVSGGPNGDSDNDGVNNLTEYALINGGERGVLSGYTITFTKRGAPYGSDLTYIIQTSETLGSGSWADAVTHGPGLLVSNPTISYTFTPGSPVKNFARLKVEQAP